MLFQDICSFDGTFYLWYNLPPQSVVPFTLPIPVLRGIYSSQKGLKK